MNRQSLVVGERYIVTGVDEIGVFQGVHDGRLVDADGVELLTGANGLRFEFTRDDGTRYVKIFDNGKAVEETESAQQAREAEQSAQEARREQALKELEALLAPYGVTVSTERRRYDTDRPPLTVYVRAYSSTEHLDDFSLDDVSIDVLRAFMAGPRADHGD